MFSRLTDAHIGRALDLDLNVHGAPNFRAPRTGSLNVFGAAQPRSQGLRAILSILRARPTETSPSHVIWFSTREEPIGKLCLDEICSCLPNWTLRVPEEIVYISGRPFVLRDSSEPRNTLPLSDRAENLEAIEQRLKNDILAESIRYGRFAAPLNMRHTCFSAMQVWRPHLDT
jgi:hypothetical protein